MDNILFVNVCVRENSRTLEFAHYLLDKLKGNVTEVCPHKKGMLPLDENRLKRRDELIAKEDFSAPDLEETRRFAEADVIVIAAPYWDLSFPALLKIYTENITVCGVTFYYSEEGIPISLCKCKKLYYITSSGGPVIYNMGFEYIKTLSEGFFGIKDINFVSAEGLDIYGADTDKIIEEAKNKIDNMV